MSKSRRGSSATAPAAMEVIEILDDPSDSNDSVHPVRETRSKNKTNKMSAFDKKMRTLREEGGVATFNPDKSAREKRKISKVAQATQGRKRNQALYSPTGIFLQTGLDSCDCLEEDCTGCFFPCNKCSGTKCGGTCRRRRNWFYDNVTVDGQSKPNFS